VDALLMGLREELLAISDGRQQIKLRGVKGCLNMNESIEASNLAESLLLVTKNSNQGSTARLVPDWSMLPPLP
jgi:hypothetical protein